ncbi:hypothetical protein Tco_1303431 [Tanacetum coccineum]
MNLMFVDTRDFTTQADGSSEHYRRSPTPELPLVIAPPIPLSESTVPILVPILCRTARMDVRVPHAMSSGLSAGMAEVAAMSESMFRKRVSIDSEGEMMMRDEDIWLRTSNFKCYDDLYMMYNLMFVDPESSTQADGAQSFREPVPLPEDPFEAIRTARMDVRVPHAMSSGLSAGMAEVAAMSESMFRKSEEDDDEEDEEIEERMDSDSVSKDAEDEGPTAKDEDPAAEDDGLTAGVEGPSMDDEGYGLDDESCGINDKGHSIESDGLGLEEEDETVPGGQHQVAPVVGMTMSAPLELGYGALRRRELALEEADVYTTFEVGHGSGSAPESKKSERVSAFRQLTLITWTDPEDGMIYIDIPDYPPLAPPLQTQPSPEWTSFSLPISLSHSDVPSPISSPIIPLTVPYLIATPAAVETEGFLTKLGAQVEMQGELIRDHAVRLEELSPALFERYDRDIGELFTRLGAVRDEIFSQRYRFRSLKYEQERVAGENQELRLQLAEERRARLEFAEVIDGGIIGRFWNGLLRMGTAEMVDQARFAWGFLSVFGNANSDRVAITSKTGSYPDTD